MSEKIIYFMRPVGMVGPIKIGCSRWIDLRLKALSIWSPFPLEVIHTEEGPHELERKLHRCFADLHSHNEWFHAGPRLLAALEAMKAGKKISEAVDLSDDHGSILARIGPRPKPPELVGYVSYSSRMRHAVDRAEKLTGKVAHTPDDVRVILRKWDGQVDYRKPRNPIRPTDEEFRRLEEVIKNPVEHCVAPNAPKRTKPKWPPVRASVSEHASQ